jgi:hypothetical protein
VAEKMKMARRVLRYELKRSLEERPMDKNGRAGGKISLTKELKMRSRQSLNKHTVYFETG